MDKNDIRVEEEMAAVITAAISAYLGHGNFIVRSIKPPPSREYPVNKHPTFEDLIKL